MTIQEAAHQILNERQQPLDSKTIAKVALDSRLVESSALDPISSLAQTIEKNIRDDVYNRPRLVFVHEGRHRLIGLPGTNSQRTPLVSQPAFLRTTPQQLSVRIPSDLVGKIRLAEQAKIGASFDDTVTALIREGLSVVAPQIKQAIEAQLKELPADDHSGGVTDSSSFAHDAPAKSPSVLPSSFNGTPQALRQILEVAHLVRSGSYTRTAATSFVAKQHRVFPQTVLDKYCRQLGLTAREFDRLLEQADGTELRKLLKSKFPGYDEIIDKMLG